MKGYVIIYIKFGVVYQIYENNLVTIIYAIITMLKIVPENSGTRFREFR